MIIDMYAAGIAAVFGLLGIGLYGLMTLRNLIKVILSLQIIGKAAVLAVVVAGSISGEIAIAQSMAASVIVADTLVAVIGLALAVQMQRCHGSLDLRTLSMKFHTPPEAENGG
ncbi:MAG: NADH-quinone oxidoreductase subunit K [Anaerolineae bacterium]|nr:NADH-quinone oxidoreductase subunit K [Anaerolineae bacterium]NUQ04042.1 NADH-quinone oxidoreductase subunit K [Anaerolineae bacterium]